MMTGNRLNKRRTTFPPYDEASGLSQRDQALERIEQLLSEQLIVPFPEDILEPGDDIAPELVDLEEVVEEIKIQAVPMRDADPPLPVRRLAQNQEERAVAEKVRPEPKPSLFHSIFQAFILVFISGWVFLLGVLVGRGHIWQSGYSHRLSAWIEQKVGWGDQTGPELVLPNIMPAEDSNSWVPPSAAPQAPRAAFEARVADDEDPALKISPDQTALSTAQSGQETDEEDDGAYPVWNWNGWNPSAGEEAGLYLTAASNDDITVGSLSTAELTLAATEAEEEYPPAVPADGDNEERPAAAAVEAAESPSNFAGDRRPSDSSVTMPGAMPYGDGKFAVQIALAFDEAEAERRVARLERQGFTAYFYKNPNNRYPVRVGHFSTRQDADAAKVQLELLGYKGPYVSSLSN